MASESDRDSDADSADCAVDEPPCVHLFDEGTAASAADALQAARDRCGFDVQRLSERYGPRFGMYGYIRLVNYVRRVRQRAAAQDAAGAALAQAIATAGYWDRVDLSGRLASDSHQADPPRRRCSSTPLTCRSTTTTTTTTTANRLWAWCSGDARDGRRGGERGRPAMQAAPSGGRVRAAAGAAVTWQQLARAQMAAALEAASSARTRQRGRAADRPAEPALAR